ncbi:MAG: SLBB domain-containing protein [Candidatus Latescibacterota bacterium]
MNGFDRATQGARLLLFMSLAPMTLGSEARAQPTGIISTIVEVEEEEQPSTAVLPAVMIGMEAYHELLRTGRYLVGPGDRFLVQISDAEDPVDARVLAEGGVFLPRIGRVQVGGRPLSEARAAIDSAFHANVRVGEIAVELSELRQFPLSVTGLVVEPGATVANAVQRVSEVIRKVGGVLPHGSTRNIRLIRTGELAPDVRDRLQARARVGDLSIVNQVASRRVDLVLYRLTGRTEHNPFVVDGDIIVVPNRQQVVRAWEAWQQAGTYEHVDGDRVSDLVTLAMGPAPNMDPDNVFLFRYADEGRRQVSSPIDIVAVLAGDETADILLEPGDWIVARSRQGYHEAATVQVSGEVVRPGFYIVDQEGSRLTELIARAGGFTEKASLTKSRVIRALKAEEERNPEYDRITAIPPIARTKDEKLYHNMKSREKRGQMVVDFVALFTYDDWVQDILVRPGDAIIISTSQRTVLVSGQAASPGAVPFVESNEVADYITRAGGYGWRATRDVEVIKASTGERVSADDAERIEPGDRIWIKEKPTRDYGVMLMQTMQVVGQVATVLLLVVTVMQ